MITTRHMLFFLAAFFAAGAATAATAATESHGAMMNPAQSELGADAAFDSDGTLWAVQKISGHIAVRRSADAGRTWSNPVLVTPEPETTDVGGDARPKIAVGPKGEIYVTWTKPLSKPYTGEVKFSRSVDAGRTFSSPVVVHHDRQEITHRFDALAVNSRGQVFVAWLDRRDAAVAASGGKAYRGAAIYYAVSDDQGTTFRGDFKVADHSCECCRIALVPVSDGRVAAMWRHVFEPELRDHAVAILGPDGVPGPGSRASFENWDIHVCPHHGPGLAVDGDGRLHAVWFAGAPGREGVYYGREENDVMTKMRRVGGDAAEHADIAATGRRVAVAWKEFDGRRTQLRGMVSDDDGTTWRELSLASTAGASGHPRMLTHGGQFYVEWNRKDEPLTILTMP